jgi:hypothetical protein
MNLSEVSVAQLERALAIKKQIDSLENELVRVLGNSAATPSATSGKRKGTMSAAGRAKISAAAKARWAKFHASKGTSAATKPVKKRTMSAAARAKISAAVKARWAKVKAAKKKK